VSEVTINEIEDASINRLKFFSKLLDNHFRIPGTQFRFGFDGIIGLIPYVGDVFTFIVSGYLIIIMIRKGAGGKVLLKMVWNIWIDSALGTLPVIGDIFDFRHRANIKNIELLSEFVEEGKHQGSATSIILFLIFILIVLIALSIWLIKELFVWIIS
jgi:hypothetical protein